jgi:dihydroxyacetone kinase-like protein
LSNLNNSTNKEEIIVKKIINAVDQVENQMIQGMVKAYPQYLKKLDCGNVVARAEKKRRKGCLDQWWWKRT